MRIAIFLTALAASAALGAERPNFLWLTCEDISPYLGCYGFEQAQTPNLDRLASQGVRYTRAYSNAPVCAVARSTLLTGMFSSTLGTHQMRSTVQLPETTPAYPRLFREAGYYCTNNSKKDYNSNFSNDPSLWDESSNKAHWKNRAGGQPFFAVFNVTVTHESQLSENALKKYLDKGQIPESPRVSPEKIELPPYHPDLPEIRQDWARLHDLITLMDSMMGERLRELEEAGLADDTIVFFYSDHGGQLARSKRYIYNVGTQVPFIVRVPQKWKHLAPGEPGAACPEIAEFVDFPKTVLSLAEIEVPDLMQGRVLFGPGKETPHPTAHLYRDRMGERYDFSRAVTDGRHYFIRNFMPHRPNGRDSVYGYQVQANWRAWRDWHDADPEAAGPIRSQFFQPKPPVQFFDTANDPWHVKNLADLAARDEVKKQLEADLDRWMIETRDVGLIPEPLIYDLIGPEKPFQSIYEYAQSDAYPIEQILEAAKTASVGATESLAQCRGMLADANPVIRHWGAYGLFRIREDSNPTQNALRKMIGTEAFPANRIMAAQALGLCGDPDIAFATIMKEADEAANGYVFLLALNAFQYSHTDGGLTKKDWETFGNRKPAKGAWGDQGGFEYARRIIDDALAIWPLRRRVD